VHSVDEGEGDALSVEDASGDRGGPRFMSLASIEHRGRRRDGNERRGSCPEKQTQNFLAGVSRAMPFVAYLEAD